MANVSSWSPARCSSSSPPRCRCARPARWRPACSGDALNTAAAAGGEFVYARRGSAGSTLGPDDVERAPLREAGAVVVSGITPALSESCAAAVDAAPVTPSCPDDTTELLGTDDPPAPAPEVVDSTGAGDVPAGTAA